ncbi:ABC transporter ATP-binding protein [Nioella ostreopsis]|uniref:ABC transporter ATP-binding protein n=1 Tax=Nioella ostreopsis TaxID=2448479 RepID=UPI000FDB1D97|nr:ABC transporter ATP-binding protein [Nioella ostreopsis]
MIEFRNLRKVFVLNGRRRVVIDNLNISLPTNSSVALLGRNGAGKSTLLQLISGAMDPTSGEIRSSGSISWPVGFAGSFHPDLTGFQNTKFIARVYGVDTEELAAFVEEFAELGQHYYLPFRSYSSGMRSRLSFGVSMGIPFDTYLVDEVTSVGDMAFREKSQTLFLERMETAGAFMVSHNTEQLRAMCDVGVVLEGGRAIYYEDLDEAIDHHNRNMKGV